MPLEVAVQKEDRRIEPRRTNFETKNADRPGVVLVAFQELEPDLVVEQVGGLIAEVAVGQRAEGLLEGGLEVPWVGRSLMGGSLNKLCHLIRDRVVTCGLRPGLAVLGYKYKLAVV